MPIELQDFTKFEPFNTLREKMQATELGFFEIFNPLHHLTGNERSDLERIGISLPRQQLMHLLDFTLVYKNSRIIMLDDKRFHVAFCSVFPIQESYLVSTALIEPNVVRVCEHCLTRLHYKGYDPLKARKEAYSLQVLEEFQLSQFWAQFPTYPVSEKRDIRKQIS
jgi:hypothetical protein